MPNLRIIYDNAVDRAASLTATNTSASYPLANLQTDVKSDVWRATGTSTAVAATWASPEPIQAIAWPICNWSPAATQRVRVTTELSAANLLTAPSDFTNAAWTKTSATLSAGVAGPDGANSATTLTATGANAEIRQTRTVTAGAYSSSIFIRRRTGSGAISVRNAANTTWVPLTLTAAWSRAVNDGGTTGTSAYLAIQIAISGDAVDISFGQLEAGAATSYYPGVRPIGYIDAWQSYAYDVTQAACPAPALRPRGWTAAQAAGAYAYGGGACARHWMPAELQATGVALTVSDPSNLQGYLESTKLIIGPYWSPTYNAADASLAFADSTALYRTDAGGQGADAGYIYKRVSIDMSMMPAADRAVCAKFLRNSRAYPIFLSLFPEDADLGLERDNSVYGRRTQDSDLTIENSIYYGTKIAVEEI